MALRGGAQSQDNRAFQADQGPGEHKYDDLDDDLYQPFSNPLRDEDRKPPRDPPRPIGRSPDVTDDDRSSPDRSYSPERDRSPPHRNRSPHDRNRSPSDRRDRRRHSPDRYRDRDRSPSDRNRDRDRSPSDRYRDRDRSPSDRYRDKDRSPSDRYRNRSPPDRYRDRDRPPSDRYRDRDRPPSDRYRDKDRSPSDRNRDRRHSPQDRRPERRRPSPDRHPSRRLSPSRSDSDDSRASPRRSRRPPSPADSYDDPWDSMPRKGKKPSTPYSKTPPKDKPSTLNSQKPESKYNTYESYAPNYQGYDGPNNDPYRKSNGLNNNNNVKKIGRQILGPESLTPSDSKSRDSTSFPSQGSMLNIDDTNDKRKLIYGVDENEERGNWTGKFDFILSMIGYAIGLGNVWRFPYLCYRNGGGAFLFPFILMMFMIGLPLFFLESSLGQFTSCGATTCWNYAPLFKGVGVAMVIVSAMTGIYYNMILGWALHYMFASFTSDLPFLTCDNNWNTQDCKLKLPKMECDGDSKGADGTCKNGNGKEIGLWNKTLFFEATGRKLKSPSQEYWERSVLGFSDGIHHFGQPKWDLALCLLLAWVICFFCLIKGIKSTGKVVYFTALFPYVVLIILLFRGVTLENAEVGIYYFITPVFEKLGDANVWKDAANQIFFSMGIAGGGLITLSSYNRFHSNILRDSIIVTFGDSLTCILGGFVIFSYLGYMAGQLEVDIQDVAADGAGLAFVVYPEAVSNLPPPTLWALLFFIMLLTLGLDSQFTMIETVLTGIIDQFPKLRARKVFVLLAICIVLFILGLPLTCPGGMYMLQLMDNYVGGMTLIIIGFIEVTSITYIYGVRRFCRDIQLMTGSTIFIYWKVTWCVLSPLTIVFIFIFMFIDYKGTKYDTYTYPGWADAMGWLMTFTCIISIPIIMLYKICREKEGKSIWQRIRLLCLPSVYWGPALPKHRELITYVDGFQVDPLRNLKSKNRFANRRLQRSLQPSVKTESRTSLLASRISVISSLSKMTIGTQRSEKSGISFETNV
ncbi:sodium-dependent proline transporter-like [Physella acuta]|uniref:sodium-dependent proline transporter-like n=1 Tax=Physella acuta TaxID=109671 RepID=UPI0027DB8527|nr:sodium-dependent proline transporter-like [Physella acuta]